MAGGCGPPDRNRCDQSIYIKLIPCIEEMHVRSHIPTVSFLIVGCKREHDPWLNLPQRGVMYKMIMAYVHGINIRRIFRHLIQESSIGNQIRWSIEGPTSCSGHRLSNTHHARRRTKLTTRQPKRNLWRTIPSEEDIEEFFLPNLVAQRDGENCYTSP